MMTAIETKNLTKRYKDLLAVDDLNLEVKEGECFGLLGPNGAGKTSLIRMITGVSPATHGDIWVQGNNLKTHARQVKAILGVVPQLDNLDPDLTVFQNLMTFARYFDVPKSEAHRRSTEILALFALDNKRDSKIDELSGGMKRRLLIARGLINNPKILILDEPTIGLDPQAKYLVWHQLNVLKSQGVTNFLCTQNMEEASALCDRVAIMHQGKILSLDTPQALITNHVGTEVWEFELTPEKKSKSITELKNQEFDFEDAGDRLRVFHADTSELIKHLVEFSKSSNHRLTNLEDVFLRLTGRSLIE